MTKAEFIRNQELEYAPKYYVEGVVRSNDIDGAGEIAEYLYYLNAKTVKHIKTVRAMVEGKIPQNVSKAVNVYWYEGIGYAEEAARKSDNPDDIIEFENDYNGTFGEGYAHAVEFDGFFSEKGLAGLIDHIKSLSSKIRWAAEIDAEFGEYSDSVAECSVELKIESAEDDDEEETA